ncbi:hypothetical protein [Brevundimonas sp.]|uniref:hypothetical protein n=1 Tax=Brevundimonas sp. TaxID=1871086 RepID=UPI00272A1581|nr:hypothetical protein [Brevundimonas sp.]
MGWEMLGGAIAGALIGGVIAAIIQWVRKKKTLPMWPVLTFAILFMLSAALRSGQISN